MEMRTIVLWVRVVVSKVLLVDFLISFDGSRISSRSVGSPRILSCRRQARRRWPMDRISRFVVWICSKFDREQIIRIINELTEVLANRHLQVMPKEDFKKTSQLSQLLRRPRQNSSPATRLRPGRFDFGFPRLLCQRRPQNRVTAQTNLIELLTLPSFAPVFARSFFRTRAVTPSVEVAPIAPNAIGISCGARRRQLHAGVRRLVEQAVARHAGHLRKPRDFKNRSARADASAEIAGSGLGMPSSGMPAGVNKCPNPW